MVLKNKKKNEWKKNIIKSIKRKCKNDHESIKEIFLKIEKILKRHYAKDKDYYYKRNRLLNHLINCIEDLENISLN